jgi:serine/threonine protein kinase
LEELKNGTNNFSDEIGSGGYGNVYKGTLVDGTRVAIKRAEPGSMQGVVEFKNEIELLSRVHHRNLVSLIGFCYEQGEQMLVYEYISNGTLRENLLGTTLTK